MSQAFEVFNQAQAGDASSGTISLSTMGTSRIVLLFVHTDAATRRTVSSVSDTNGLTWALYKAYNFDSEDPTNHKQRLEVWWAYAAAQQTANTVTVTLSGSSAGPSLVIGAVTGVDPSRFTSPFDADASLPATQSNPSGTSTDATLTFSTHDSHDAVLSVFASNITNIPPTTPAGYTALATLNYANSVRMILFVYGKVYTAQQVNTVVNMGSTKDWGIEIFAIGGDILFPHGQAAIAGF